MILPVGLGMGATQPAQLTKSPSLAAGRPDIKTVDDPCATIPGPLGTQVGKVQTLVMLVTVAASNPLILMVGWVAEMIGWGIGG